MDVIQLSGLSCFYASVVTEEAAKADVVLEEIIVAGLSSCSFSAMEDAVAETAAAEMVSSNFQNKKSYERAELFEVPPFFYLPALYKSFVCFFF